MRLLCCMSAPSSNKIHWLSSGTTCRQGWRSIVWYYYFVVYKVNLKRINLLQSEEWKATYFYLLDLCAFNIWNSTISSRMLNWQIIYCRFIFSYKYILKVRDPSGTVEMDPHDFFYLEKFPDILLCSDIQEK